ncbi:uncharacterized protein EI97DRAFT_432765 [Westerdykella ornata]|uniref:Tudor domain-containing protein n=1 Tax=Westerdykella ornata TaxID=318751 RepID=A0A6A6JKN6_WESOR|nr:uncharacterized protein EI97DRAFT_432765 [Westerdykella ornata]KAF2277151.1 hypothetical protein EI97DRAFT_432765 [Westerdykella ornata]
MADKTVLNKINALKREISQKEAERKEWAGTLPGLDDIINGDPEEVSEESVKQALELKADAEVTIAGIDKDLRPLYEELEKLNATLPKPVEPAAPKFDPEKHPLLKKASEKVESEKPVTFNAGDMCEAQWTDGRFYKAKVQTVLGSVSDPKYHVRFIDYKDSSSTVGRDAIRPLYSDRKRKADGAPATPTAAPATSSPHVISGPASMNPKAVANDAGKDTSVPINRRKIGGNKALERKQTSWQEFTKKGPGKSITKKESMFRTGEGLNSRVGFTGSGGGMTQAPKRVRYTHKYDDDEEDSRPSHSVSKHSDRPRVESSGRKRY